MSLDRMKLILFEAGQNLITDGETLRAQKPGNAQYVREMSRHFGRTSYVTNCHTPRTSDCFEEQWEKYARRFDPDGIDLKLTHGFLRDGTFSKLASQVGEFAYLLEHVDSRTVVVVFVNGLYGLLKVPMLLAATPPHVFAYYGSNPLHYAEELRGRGGLGATLKASLIRSFHLRLVRLSEGVFLRDLSMTRDFPESTNVCFSHPFNGYSTQDLHDPGIREGDGPVKLLFVGSLIRRKGAADLLRALRQLGGSPGGEPGEFELTVIGDGPQEERLRAMASSLGLADRVHFEGFVGDREALRNHYRRADLLVVPSRHEGFPRVITEAMSQGLPVVATNVDGIEMVLEHERECLLVEPKEPASLAGAIRRLARSSELRRRLSENGLEFAAGRLRVSPAVQHVRFIRECVAGRGEDGGAGPPDRGAVF